MYARSRLFLYVSVRGSGSGPASSTAAGGSSSSSSSGRRDYMTSEGIADAFHASHHRAAWTFDHVLVDIPSIINSVAFMARDLVGHERDKETVRNAHRQLQTIILRRLQPRKSLALLFDGSEPLWMLEKTRLFPGRRYDSKFYRSCASPMPHLLEEKLRSTAMELRTPPWETVISGPATPGLSEGKMSAYLLDLATRMLRPPAQPTGLCPAVTAGDTVCVVGAPELAWMGLGVTPFQNITTVTLQQGELTSCSVQETMAWLRLGHLTGPTDGAATTTAVAGAEGESSVDLAQQQQQQQQQQRRLSAARTDVVFLYLLTHGHSATGLPQVLSTPFADVLDAYIALEAENAQRTLDASPPLSSGEEDGVAPLLRFRSILFDEEPITLASLSRPSLRLRVASLQKVLVRVYNAVSSGGSGGGANLPASSKPVPHVATLLTWTLQAHGLLCSGGVPSPDWTPTPDIGAGNSSSGENAAAVAEGGAGGTVAVAAATAMLDKYPKVSLEMLIQHLGYLVNTNAAAAGAGSQETHFCPPRSRSFGLTAVEALLMTATQPDQIHQILPLYARGHSLSDAAAKDITGTRNVHEALRKTQQAVGGAVAQAETELTTLAANPPRVRDVNAVAAGLHPALAHLPSHLFVRAMGSQGPPPGWSYYGIHLGIKAEAMNVRYCLNAGDTATPRVIDAGVLSQPDTLFVWAARGSEGEGTWTAVPCAAAGSSSAAAAASTPSGEADAAAAVSTLRVLTWNSQFDRHSKQETPLGRAGIDWCTATRYIAASKVLAAAEADVICLQEVEPAWVSFLCAQSWVREAYALSAVDISPALHPHGVLLLVRRGVGVVKRVRHVNLPATAGYVAMMPELMLQVGREVAPVVVGGLHLVAPYTQRNENDRVAQLAKLESHLTQQMERGWEPATAAAAAADAVDADAAARGEKPASGSAASTEEEKEDVSYLLIGDFNDYPTRPYRPPAALAYKDAWELLNPNCHRSTATAAERGYTIDGAANPYTAKIIEPKFFGRPDRILFRSKQLQPIDAELVGTATVMEVLPKPAGGGPLMKVNNPAEAVPDYLYPSDHFGVLVEFQLV